MCKIVILEPKEKNCHKNSTASFLPPPQEKVDAYLTKKKAEEKGSDKKPTSTLPPTSTNINHYDFKKTGKLKSSVHDVVHNKIKNQKKPKNGNSTQQHIVPKAIRHISVTPPSPKSWLPRNVRFATDDKQNTESGSAGSVSSDESYTDPPKLTPPDFYPGSDYIKAPWEPRNINETQALHMPMMMEDTDPIESDTSSRIDEGDIISDAFSPVWEGNFETQAPPIQQISPVATEFQSLYDGKTPLDLPNNTGHTLTASINGAGTDALPKFGSDHEWDSDSDQESAIDCSELDLHMQVTNSNFDKDWVQNQDSHVNDGFDGWLERLDNPSSQSLSFEDTSEPLFIYRHKGNESATSETEPIFAIKTGSDLDHFNLDACNGINADCTSAYNFQPPDMMNDTAGIHILRNQKDRHMAIPSLHKLPTFIDVENPTQYNPGLGIYWRDV